MESYNFHNCSDSLIKFHDFQYFRESHIDFFYFHDSLMEFYDLIEFRNFRIEFQDFHDFRILA